MSGELPTAVPGPGKGDAARAPGAGDSAPPPPGPDVRPGRLLATLGLAGALAGFLVVVVYQATLPAIEANRAAALDAAIQEVLKAPHAYDTLYLHQGALVSRLPEGVDPRSLERVFLGYRADGTRIGVALAAREPGFQDIVSLLFGYDPEERAILGMKVLDNRETPGLGDKIVTDRAFVEQFDGARAPLMGVKPGTAREPHEVDMITGATISARTVVTAINRALERWGPLLESLDGAAPGARP